MSVDAQRSARAAPLWKRLLEAQQAASTASASRRVPLAFSCVVVPPPVPAAQSRFDSHIASLVEHVQPLAFLTVTSRTPYLPENAKTHASSTASTVPALSPTQAAIVKIVETMKAKSVGEEASVMLTVTGTMPATPDHTHLTQAGLEAMLHDYLDRAVATETNLHRDGAWLNPCGAGFVAMRGVDGGFTRQTWTMTHTPQQKAEAGETRTPLLRTPYGDFQDGKSLVDAVLRVEGRCAAQLSAPRGENPFTVCVPGFPEGHALHRLWGCAEAEGREAGVLAGPEKGCDKKAAPVTARAYAYLASLESTLERTSIPFHGGAAAADRIDSGVLAECIRKLILRTEAAMELGTVPAYLAPETLEAEVEELVHDKLVPIACGGGARGAHTFRAPVVVTQTILDPDVFIAYAELVRRRFREAWANQGPLPHGDAEGLPGDVVVLPGVLSPQRGEDFTRTILQLCVRTATTDVQNLLQSYKDDLTKALHTWEQTIASEKTSDGSTTQDAAANAASTLHAQKEQAETHFQNGMEAVTMSVCRRLVAAGYGHLYFSAFAYGCGEALGRVVEQLHAEQSPHQHHL